jgi:hypothetical protein
MRNAFRPRLLWLLARGACVARLVTKAEQLRVV